MLGDALVVAALDEGALLADFAHVVEEQCLYAIVFSFFRTFEECVVDLAEQAGQVLCKPVHHQLSAVLHQLTEAGLYAAAGKARRPVPIIWRVGGAH